MASNSNQDNRNSQTLPGGLYLVATPIGNLRDITLRALDVLHAADLIACEDTRITSRLMSHFGIRARLQSFHEHNEGDLLEQMLGMLREGKRVALVSDAGTPLISDPGFKLVREAAEQGIKIYPIPGASSVLAALCASGLPTDRFMFVGFLPSKESARVKEIDSLATADATLVLFESPRRLQETLQMLADKLGNREAMVAREMTKLYETFYRGTLQHLAAQFDGQEPKGEVVIVIAPPEKTEAIYNEDTETALKKALESLSVKDAAAKLARETGLPRQELYTQALMLKAKHEKP